MTSSTPKLTIAAINCRGVKGRVDKINEFLRKERGVSVMVLSETWLREGEAAPRFEGSEIVVDERGVVSEGLERVGDYLYWLAWECRSKSTGPVGRWPYFQWGKCG